MKMNKNDIILGKTKVEFVVPGTNDKISSGLVVDTNHTSSEDFYVIKDLKTNKNINVSTNRITNIVEFKMNKQQEKLLVERVIRPMVKKVLREDVSTHDEDYLYRILKVSGPKISKALENLQLKYKDDKFAQGRLERISRGWNELAFGYGDLYHRIKGK